MCVLYLPVDLLLLMPPALDFLSGFMLSFAQTPPTKSHTYIPAKVAVFRLHGSVVRNRLVGMTGELNQCQELYDVRKSYRPQCYELKQVPSSKACAVSDFSGLMKPSCGGLLLFHVCCLPEGPSQAWAQVFI